MLLAHHRQAAERRAAAELKEAVPTPEPISDPAPEPATEPAPEVKAAKPSKTVEAKAASDPAE
jgi:hypothetical protein